MKPRKFEGLGPFSDDIRQRVIEAATLLTGEMGRQTSGGPGVEPQTAAMFEAVLGEDDPVITGLLVEVAKNSIVDRKIKSGAAVSAFRTTLIHYFVTKYSELGQTFDDANLLTASKWHKPISLLKKDLHRNETSSAVEALWADITFRVASTPVKERYFADELVVQLAKDRFPNGARVLDIGSSIMAGPLQIMHKAEYPMSLTRVVAEHATSGKTIDLTSKANSILGLSTVFNKFVCVDSTPFYHENRQSYDLGNKDYSLSGLRPSERNNPAYFSSIQSLISKKQIGTPEYEPDTGVEFHRADMVDKRDLTTFRDKYPEPFDVITMNYLTQELSAKQVRKLHGVACSLLQEGGIILYTHQAYLHPWNVVQPASINNLRQYEVYATIPYRSHMHAVDNLHPTKPWGLQELMSFYNNRCRDVRLSAGKLVVNGALEPITDLIRNAAV